MFPEFTSILKNEFTLFIKHKRGAGLKYETEIYRLKCIDERLNDLNVSEKEITPETFEYLSSRQGMKDANFSEYLIVLNDFCRFLSITMGYKNIYSKKITVKVRNDYIPTIYDEETMNTLFEQSNTLIIKNTGSKYYRYYFGCAIILRLLYSCGLRMKEAIDLPCHDINTKEHYLKIEKSKNDRSRIVALSDSMNKCLTFYLNLFCIDDDPVFINSIGTKLSDDSFRKYYHKLQEKCGLAKNRPHDLRHVFCNNSLHQLLDKGYNLNVASVYLYKYMGHSNFSETEYYLHFTDIEADKIRKISSINDPDILSILNRDEGDEND